MSDLAKATTVETLCGLLIMSGFMMIVGAVPGGIASATALMPDPYWTAIAFVVMAIASSLVGAVLLMLGSFWVKRHWNGRNNLVPLRRTDCDPAMRMDDQVTD